MGGGSREDTIFFVGYLLHQSFAMENRNATTILSMKISCCNGCPRKLEKKLLKMDGVNSVEIDTEKDLVYVTGTINPTTLLNNVAKLGKAVKLQPTDEHSYTRNNEAPKTRKMHKNCCCCCCEDGRHVNKKKLEEEHKCETYELPKVDLRFCRDLYCEAHNNMHTITGEVPADKFGIRGLPFYGWAGQHGGSYGGGPYPYQPYGYFPRPRMAPQLPFGYQYRH